MIRKAILFNLLLAPIHLNTLSATNNNNNIDFNDKSNQEISSSSNIFEIKNESPLHTLILKTKKIYTIQEKVRFILNELKPMCQYDFDMKMKLISPNNKKENSLVLHSKSSKKARKKGTTASVKTTGEVQCFTINGFDTVDIYHASLLGNFVIPFLLDMKNMKQKTIILNTIEEIIKDKNLFPKEHSLFWRIIDETANLCAIKIQKKPIERRFLNKKEQIMVPHFENIIYLMDYTPNTIDKIYKKICDINLLMRNFSDLSSDEINNKDDIIKKLKTNVTLFYANANDLENCKDIKERVDIFNKLTKESGDLLVSLDNLYLSIEKSRESIENSSITNASPKKDSHQEPCYEPHPKAITPKNSGVFLKLANKKDEEELESQNKKKEHKETRKPKQDKYERQQNEIKYYNELVEIEKENARKAREENNNTNESVQLYPDCPKFLEGEENEKRYHHIMKLIHDSKNIGQLVKAIMNDEDKKSYNFERLKGTDYFSIRHNDGLRYVIWQGEDGLKAILTKHYKGL